MSRCHATASRPASPISRRLVLGLVAGVVLAGVVLVGCGSPSGGSTAGGSTAGGTNGTAKLRIAVIPKGTTHAFWKSVEAGARKAGEEAGVEILWKGPLKEDDRAAQVQVVQSFTADGVDGIVLAPLDDVALLTPVKAAAGKKIPVVIIDSPLKGQAGTDFAALVATDNRKAGELGAEKLAKEMGEKGKVVLLRYGVGSASTTDREEGFLTKMRSYPGIEVISDNNYAGATQAEALTKAMQMGDTLRRANGVFTPNESATLGMVRALGQLGLAGKIKFVGFDATPELVENLKKGEIQGLVAQDPMKMGYEGVRTLLARIKGGTVAPSVDTGAVVIDAANLDSAEVKALLAGM